MTDGPLFAFGAAVFFVALAGSYVYMRGPIGRAARLTEPLLGQQPEAVERDPARQQA